MQLLFATVLALSFGFATFYLGWMKWREPARPRGVRILDEVIAGTRDRYARLTPQESAALAAHNAQRAARKARFWSRVAFFGTVLSVIGGLARLLSHC